MAVPQVMVDAANAEKSKTYPEYASDLQAFPYGAFSILAIIGYLTSGFLILAMGSEKLFLLITITSIPLAYAAFKLYLGEGTTTYVYNDTRQSTDPKVSLDDEISNILHSNDPAKSLKDADGAESQVAEKKRRQSFGENRVIFLRSSKLSMIMCTLYSCQNEY